MMGEAQGRVSLLSLVKRCARFDDGFRRTVGWFIQLCESQTVEDVAAGFRLFLRLLTNSCGWEQLQETSLKDTVKTILCRLDQNEPSKYVSQSSDRAEIFLCCVAINRYVRNMSGSWWGGDMTGFAENVIRCIEGLHSNMYVESAGSSRYSRAPTYASPSSTIRPRFPVIGYWGSRIEHYKTSERRPRPSAVPSSKVPPTILWESEHLVVLFKPPYWKCTPEKTRQVNSVESLVHSGRVESVQGFVKLCYNFDLSNCTVSNHGLCHRIDKETSGPIIVAKDASTKLFMAGQIHNHEMKKEYVCLVHGLLKKKEAAIEAPIKQMAGASHVSPQDGKAAFTKYRVEREFRKVFVSSRSEHTVVEHYSLCNVAILTGRTHQIRVHMNYIGHPLVSDSTYLDDRQLRSDREWCRRSFLHCHSLMFSTPRTCDGPGETIRVDCPLLGDLEDSLKYIEEIGRPLDNPHNNRGDKTAAPAAQTQEASSTEGGKTDSQKLTQAKEEHTAADNSTITYSKGENQSWPARSSSSVDRRNRDTSTSVSRENSLRQDPLLKRSSSHGTRVDSSTNVDKAEDGSRQTSGTATAAARPCRYRRYEEPEKKAPSKPPHESSSSGYQSPRCAAGGESNGGCGKRSSRSTTESCDAGRHSGDEDSTRKSMRVDVKESAFYQNRNAGSSQEHGKSSSSGGNGSSYKGYRWIRNRKKSATSPMARNIRS
eukprot:GHVQ01004406.1.p1 GENE.GHVQ01004406.1~~GHVQ01004406.1.p1  ORF type:complete len:710 (+),score=55.27 GHVQ01004406.1:429-2558(+)